MSRTTRLRHRRFLALKNRSDLLRQQPAQRLPLWRLSGQKPRRYANWRGSLCNATNRDGCRVMSKDLSSPGTHHSSLEFPMALLETINSPADLQRLNMSQLPELAAELRHFI